MRVSSLLSVIILSVLLHGCAQMQAQPDDSVVENDTSAKPSDPAAHATADPCDQQGIELDTSPTWLERGHKALWQGEYDRAHRYFQRYRRSDTRLAVRWEADVADAFLAALPDTPYYQPEQARAALKTLQPIPVSSSSVSESSLMLNYILPLLLSHQQAMGDMEKEVETLKNDVALREAALKRLRELTLSQQAGGR